MEKFKKTGYALRTQECFLGNRAYKFIQGEPYEIDNEEVWNKLTNPVQPVLRPEARKHVPTPGIIVEKDYNDKTDKLRGRGKK